MAFSTAVFWIFAAILVFAALRVVTTRNPVHAALWLVLAFFSAAAIWLTLGAEFLAITLVLVYVGAVMVLFLFVVMMLDVNFEDLRKHFRSYIPVGATVGVLVLVEMVLVIVSGAGAAGEGPAVPPGSNTKALGPGALHGLRVPVRAGGGPAADRDRRRDRDHAPEAARDALPGSVASR